MKALFIALLCSFTLIVACDDGGKKSGPGDAGDTDTDTDTDSDTDTGPEPEPGDEFDQWCGDDDWDAELTEATINELGQTYLGVYDLPVGTCETMKVIPEHPFQVTTIRAAFAGAPGPVRLWLMEDFGRSYPAWIMPDHELDPDGALIGPIEMEITDPAPDQWVEIDVTAEGAFLEPTQHYFIVNERLEGGPAPALEELAEGEWSHALMLDPFQAMPYGSEGNFRLQLVGNYFCVWSEEERLFGEDGDQPWIDDGGGGIALADLDGDDHDDLVTYSGGPQAYLGDGQGGFADPGFDPFPDAASASMMLFGDVDNDGDVDAFAGPYVGADDDGDGWEKLEGDCNDRDEWVYPMFDEVLGNLYDDDCDGVADDGTDESDNDEDGVTILAGDCDDTRDDVYPDAPELLDGYDNDCDLEVDEDFANMILLNDGTGLFSELVGSGLDGLDQSTAAGFGDGDADGNLDIYWGNWLVNYPGDPAVHDRYFTGVGDGTFVDAVDAAGLVPWLAYSCYGMLWNDFNNDGHQDIFVGNYHMYPNFLWENQGDGTFDEVAELKGLAYDAIPGPDPLLAGGHSYGGDFGDVDNDGDMDVFICNLAHPRVQPWSDPSMFAINEGPPDYTFTNQTEEYGFIYDEGDINAMFADFDNDMDLDIAVGPTYPGHFSKLYRNDGSEGFTDVSYQGNVAVYQAAHVAWSDVDEDGDLDLIQTGGLAPSGVHLFINRVGQDNNWIELLLEGTTTNRDAFGARVTLTAGGVTQLRDVHGGGGRANQGSRVIHFGLAGESSIGEVTVRWVGGTTETISGLAPNGRYHVVEGSGTGTLID
ncbi:MAG: VCBS repeat-containing protein [Deltaproteobacteria bacterium]|nr:VCBS repeat-containing protein [Deltaproteobacteria bacterium]